MARIVVLSDTHARGLEQLPVAMLEAAKEADAVVHCGDYTGIEVLEGLQKLAREFIGVPGNTDPPEIGRALPGKAVFTFQGRKIGVIHPVWGGPPFGIEEEIRRQFETVDAILFGHTHEPCSQWLRGILFLNPGQGYASFRVPATYATLDIGEKGLEGQIVTLG